MSLISAADKASLHSVMKSLAETWEQDIVVYLMPEKTVISQDPNFNIFQANSQNIFNPENDPIKYTVKARILYNKDQAYPLTSPYVGGELDTAQLKLNVSESLTRIKVNESGYNVLKDSKVIELDGFQFTIDKLERPHGLFNRDYFTFYLKRSL
jgi:hypothetical protein